MAFKLHDNVRDAALDYIKQHCTKIVICDGAPATFNQAITPKGTSTGRMLAAVNMQPSDFIIQNATPNGRKIISGEKPDVIISQTGVGNHIAYLDVPNSVVLLFSPSATNKSLIATEKVTFLAASFTMPLIEIA